jgi:hypothetical protein
VDFTREPIIEAIITPREGCKLVIRSSKSAGQEEYFVDAVEIVSFGHSTFYRSLEKPKPFLVPVNDYEVLEVKEARLVLRNVGMERSIKIAGGREATLRPAKEAPAEPVEGEIEEEAAAGTKAEKKRDRRRQYRRRRGREEKEITEEKVEIPAPTVEVEGKEASEGVPVTTAVLSSLLPPPPTLIRETIARYKQDALFKDVFIQRPEDEEGEKAEEDFTPHEKVKELLEEEEPAEILKSVEDNIEEEEDLFRMRESEEVSFAQEPEALPEFLQEEEESTEKERSEK